MPHFKDPKQSDRLYFLSDQDILRGGRAMIPESCKEVSDAEADAIRAAQTPVQDPKKVIAVQIAQIERETLMNRATRELMLGIAEKEGAAIGITPEQLYKVNLGYQKVKDVDNEIAALRAKL